VDITVALSLLLAPVEKTLLGGKILDADILDLETKDKSPDHTKDELLVVVANFLRADTDQLDTAVGDEIEANVQVFDVLQTHARLHGDLGKLCAADALKKVVQQNTVIQIGCEIIDHRQMTTTLQLSVEPVGEGLFLDQLPLLIHNMRTHLRLYKTKDDLTQQQQKKNDQKQTKQNKTNKKKLFKISKIKFYMLLFNC